MLETFLQALLEVLRWDALSFMLIGVVVGFWVGLLPGIGGATTLALMLPFVYRMAPVQAFAFLLGMHSVVSTTGEITSILFGIPGEATTVATILDGHAMAKKGQAGRALGASLTSSLIGAIVGAAALALAIPVVRPLVLTFGSPEFFMLAIVGIAFIASLSGRGPRGLVRGFLTGCLGLLLAAVGQDPQQGIQRYTLQQLYLWNGLDLVPVLVGFFAIPEIIDLAVRGTAIAADAPVGRLRARGAKREDSGRARRVWQGRRAGRPGSGSGRQLQRGRRAHPHRRFWGTGQFGDGHPARGLLRRGAGAWTRYADQASGRNDVDGLDHRGRQHHRGGCQFRLSQSPGPADEHPGCIADPLPGAAHLPRGLHEQQQPERYPRGAGLRKSRLLDGALPVAARAAGPWSRARRGGRAVPVDLRGSIWVGMAGAAHRRAPHPPGRWSDRLIPAAAAHAAETTRSGWCNLGLSPRLPSVWPCLPLGRSSRRGAGRSRLRYIHEWWPPRCWPWP